MKKHAGPITAAILLLLPVLYIGSYLALVQPIADDDYRSFAVSLGGPTGPGNYRFASSTCCRIFWPLEQIDKKLRPQAWVPAIQD